MEERGTPQPEVRGPAQLPHSSSTDSAQFQHINSGATPLVLLCISGTSSGERLVYMPADSSDIVSDLPDEA